MQVLEVLVNHPLYFLCMIDSNLHASGRYNEFSMKLPNKMDLNLYKQGKDIINKENPNEEYETFMEPKEIAEFIVFTISFDNNMMSSEIRLGRMK